MPLHVRTSRLGIRVALLTVLAFLTLVAAAPALPATAHTRVPPHLGEFLWGLAGEESGWDYYALNKSSDAFGRYQIMPDNWPAWAATYLGVQWADQNPLNQELVARGKVTGLYRWLHSWRRVAYWWLTGGTDSNSSHWSAGARQYVNNVMALMGRSPRGGAPLPVQAASGNGLAVHKGDWRLTTDRTPVWDGVGPGRHVLGSAHAGRLLHVLAARLGPKHRVVWIKVRLPHGAVGWINSRHTVPQRSPKHGGHSVHH